MNYLGSQKAVDWLQQQEFDHQIHNVVVARLVSRLRTERNLFDGPLSQANNGDPAVCLAVLVTGQPDVALERTLRSWALQSCPFTDCILIPADPAVLPEELRDWIGYHDEFAFARVADTDYWRQPDVLTDAEYVSFCTPGDMLHPSAATVIGILRRTDQPDIIVWNEIMLAWNYDQGTKPLSRKVVALWRKPRIQVHTLNHVNYIGLGFAVKPELLARYPGKLSDELLINRAHLFHLWLTRQEMLKWHTQPEYLSTQLGPRVSTSAKQRIAPFLSRYRENLSEHYPEFEYIESDHSQQPYRLVPKRRASTISVIIPFRDAVTITCKCLDALSKQKITGHLEVVLVDNQSEPVALREIEACAEKHRGRMSYVVAHYDKPFNHSAQCNLGIEASSGESLVLLNNDAIVGSPTAIEEMSAWSLVPQVATVGVQITSSSGDLVCAGVLGRQVLGDQSSSFTDESRDRLFAKMVRETFANTFACAALSRETYAALGPLDEIDYPNGYNDVEYCLRASAAGYIHMYLGVLRAYHSPGTTRLPTDERFQKTMLRVKYPQALRATLFQIEEDREFRKRLAKQHEGPPGKTKLVVARIRKLLSLGR